MSTRSLDDTLIKGPPNPGEQTAAGPATDSPPSRPRPLRLTLPTTAPAAAPAAAIADFVTQGVNPLTQAAAPLLILASQLRDLVHAPPMDQLQQRAVAEVRAFEDCAKSLGCANEQVITSRYLLCTFLDESVMSTPWGEQSGWRQRSLLAIFHRETWGGEKFFHILDRASQDPARHIALLELIYVCLALGFAGKYHVEERGADRLADLARALYQRIAAQRGAPEPDLSLNWQGVRDTRNPVARYVPLWVAATATATLVLGTFLWFYVSLGHLASPVEARLAVIGLEGIPITAEVATEPVPRQPLPQAPPKPRVTLAKLLADDAATGTLIVEERADRTVVTVTGAVFAPASTRIGEQHLDTLKRIGGALEQVPGRVLVIGHTDDQRLRSVRFRDNYELSRERAFEFSRILGASMSAPSRMEWSGVGPSQPRCTPENLPENRACNRRVEIVHLPGG